MKVSIIIVGERKENYLSETIKSCLNQNYKNFEIILTYSNLQNLKLLKQKFKKKIIFKKVHLRLKNPIQDQINKIKEGIKISKGKYIFLLDGDDIFKKNKIKKIIELNKKKMICLDNHINLKNKKHFYYKNNKFKKNKIYRFLLNPWPNKICTSCISGPKKLFDIFFSKNKSFKSKYLAIDVLLIIFYLKKLLLVNNILTIKTKDPQGLDNNYSNFLSIIYWKRRVEQHQYLKKIHNINSSLEYFLCLLILFFLKNLFKLI